MKGFNCFMWHKELIDRHPEMLVNIQSTLFKATNNFDFLVANCGNYFLDLPNKVFKSKLKDLQYNRVKNKTTNKMTANLQQLYQ